MIPNAFLLCLCAKHHQRICVTYERTAGTIEMYSIVCALFIVSARFCCCVLCCSLRTRVYFRALNPKPLATQYCILGIVDLFYVWFTFITVTFVICYTVDNLILTTAIFKLPAVPHKVRVYFNSWKFPSP